jgi:2,3-bisphosphoglycerate-independent phosphoglycerate mutase
MGLCSDGGVHSHIEHLEALLEAARRAGVERVVVHALLDGRDTSPYGGAGYLARALATMREKGVGRLGVVSGRYYMMDRDKRWERIELAYKALVRAEGRRTSDIVAMLKRCYEAGETDEFVKPTVVTTPDGRPGGIVSDGDVFLNFNFRADRVRQITAALTQRDFSAFPAISLPHLHYVCMTRYDERFGLPVMFPPEHPSRTFGELVAKASLKQLRIAETEKYAHVTYFFNGGIETVFDGEERILVPSPKVATYDQKPEMSAPEVTDRLVEAVSKGDFAAVIVNFANCDMVGHTGKIDAAVTAVEAVDRCLARAIPHLTSRGFTVFLTADHGNIEQMVDYETGRPFTEHTTNPVPLVVSDAGVRFKARTGKLADLAPTMLAYAGAPVPDVMKGAVLIEPTARA